MKKIDERNKVLSENLDYIEAFVAKYMIEVSPHVANTPSLVETMLESFAQLREEARHCTGRRRAPGGVIARVQVRLYSHHAERGGYHLMAFYKADESIIAKHWLLHTLPSLDDCPGNIVELTLLPNTHTPSY